MGGTNGLAPEDLEATALGRRRGWRLIETELSSYWAEGTCLRAIVRDEETGADWAISYRQWTHGPKVGRLEGFQPPRRVHAEVRGFRLWVEE